MAAGLIYTIGGSFWEFGGPDLDRAKLFVMIGTAEDHHSNPLKVAISKFKRRGGRFISINPVRTGYSAIADEWVPIKPGTDGALMLAITHEIIKQGLYDRDFLVDYTNAAELINLDPASNDYGMFIRTDRPVEEGCFDAQNKLWWDRKTNGPVDVRCEGCDPYLLGEYELDGKPVKTAFQMLKERVEEYTPEWAGVSPVSGETIKRLAHEMGVTARDQKIELPIQWTDVWGKEHDSVTGSPVAFHSMRGLAAHSNGFQTIRALGVLMTLLGTIDRPGGFRHKAPFPRPIPPCPKPPKGPEGVQPNTPLDGMPLGWPADPNDLFVDDRANPVRIDKAFSWEYPLSVHGLMHNVITNAWRGDPYKIDTLLLFMANMAWNSSMNTAKVARCSSTRTRTASTRSRSSSSAMPSSRRRSPSPTWCCRTPPISSATMRCRCSTGPISEFDGPVRLGARPGGATEGRLQAVPGRDRRAGQRLKLPAFVNDDGSVASSATTRISSSTSRPRRVPVSVSCPAGAARAARSFSRANRTRASGRCTPRTTACFHYELPKSYQYMRNWNKGYLEWARAHGMTRYAEPINVHLYSEVLQKFRLAAQGKRPGKQPPAHLAKRVETYFDPLPFYHEPLESELIDTHEYPLNALTQRPMAMYHSWDSQNAWLRQIHTYNYLFETVARYEP
jgi:anaerobic selenocysteine-containing dehydrogenase